MPVYIALLRGINVSGQKKIKMAELRHHLTDLDISNVQTYIQSGNIVFSRASEDRRSTGLMLEELIQSKYRFSVSVIVKTVSELEYILQSNPFIHDRKEDPAGCYVTFLAEKPRTENVRQLSGNSHAQEEFVLDEDIVYLYAPNGYGKAKMNNNYFENTLNVLATTRNWKTVNKLYEIATAVHY